MNEIRHLLLLGMLAAASGSAAAQVGRDVSPEPAKPAPSAAPQLAIPAETPPVSATEVTPSMLEGYWKCKSSRADFRFSYGFFKDGTYVLQFGGTAMGGTLQLGGTHALRPDGTLQTVSRVSRLAGASIWASGGQWTPTAEDADPRQATRKMTEEKVAMRGTVLEMDTVAIANLDGSNRTPQSSSHRCTKSDGVDRGILRARESIPKELLR
jgi:hypothetical protein